MNYVLDISDDPFQGVFGDARGLNEEDHASTLSLEELIWSQLQNGAIARRAELAVQELLDEIVTGDIARYVRLFQKPAAKGGERWRVLYPHALALVNSSITHHFKDHLSHIQLCVDKLHQVIKLDVSSYFLASMIEDTLHSRAFICVEEDGIEAFYKRFTREEVAICFGEVVGNALQENAFDALYAIQGHNRDPFYLDSQHWQGLARSFYCSENDLLETGLKRMQDTLNQFADEETLLAHIKEPLTRQALKLKHGMGGNRQHNLIEVGTKLGVTRERARILCVDAANELSQSPGLLAKLASGAYTS